MLNPYQPPAAVSEDSKGLIGDARLLEKRFLYRRIEFEQPFVGTLTYSGWNFRQRCWIDKRLVWYRISWVTFHRQALFKIPLDIDPGGSEFEVKIRFAPGLVIREFTVLANSVIIYNGE